MCEAHASGNVKDTRDPSFCAVAMLVVDTVKKEVNR